MKKHTRLAGLVLGAAGIFLSTRALRADTVPSVTVNPAIVTEFYYQPTPITITINAVGLSGAGLTPVVGYEYGLEWNPAVLQWLSGPNVGPGTPTPQSVLPGCAQVISIWGTPTAWPTGFVPTNTPTETATPGAGTPTNSPTPTPPPVATTTPDGYMLVGCGTLPGAPTPLASGVLGTFRFRPVATAQASSALALLTVELLDETGASVMPEPVVANGVVNLLGCVADADCDGVADASDNCPTISNLSQTNTDGQPIVFGPSAYDITVSNADALGDACDPDDDNDRLPDASEGSLTVTPGSATPCAFSGGATPTNSLGYDSDGDLVLDGVECSLGSNPLDSTSVPELCATPADDDKEGVVNENCPDADGDGLNDIDEAIIGTNPALADTDGDGLRDGYEYTLVGTDPLMPDTDADTCGDLIEVVNINGDLVVNSGDKQIITTNFNAASPVLFPPGNPPPPQPVGTKAYHWDWDMNRDGKLNSGDTQIITANFNQHCV